MANAEGLVWGESHGDGLDERVHTPWKGSAEMTGSVKKGVKNLVKKVPGKLALKIPATHLRGSHTSPNLESFQYAEPYIGNISTSTVSDHSSLHEKLAEAGDLRALPRHGEKRPPTDEMIMGGSGPPSAKRSETHAGLRASQDSQGGIQRLLHIGSPREDPILDSVSIGSVERDAQAESLRVRRNTAEKLNCPVELVDELRNKYDRSALHQHTVESSRKFKERVLRWNAPGNDGYKYFSEDRTESFGHRSTRNLFALRSDGAAKEHRVRWPLRLSRRGTPDSVSPPGGSEEGEAPADADVPRPQGRSSGESANSLPLGRPADRTRVDARPGKVSVDGAADSFGDAHLRLSGDSVDGELVSASSSAGTERLQGQRTLGENGEYVVELDMRSDDKLYEKPYETLTTPVDSVCSSPQEGDLYESDDLSVCSETIVEVEIEIVESLADQHAEHADSPLLRRRARRAIVKTPSFDNVHRQRLSFAEDWYTESSAGQIVAPEKPSKLLDDVLGLEPDTATMSASRGSPTESVPFIEMHVGDDISAWLAPQRRVESPPMTANSGYVTLQIAPLVAPAEAPSVSRHRLEVAPELWLSGPLLEPDEWPDLSGVESGWKHQHPERSRRIPGIRRRTEGLNDEFLRKGWTPANGSMAPGGASLPKKVGPKALLDKVKSEVSVRSEPVRTDPASLVRTPIAQISKRLALEKLMMMPVENSLCFRSLHGYSIVRTIVTLASLLQQKNCIVAVQNDSQHMKVEFARQWRRLTCMFFITREDKDTETLIYLKLEKSEHRKLRKDTQLANIYAEFFAEVAEDFRRLGCENAEI